MRYCSALIFIPLVTLSTACHNNQNNNQQQQNQQGSNSETETKTCIPTVTKSFSAMLAELFATGVESYTDENGDVIKNKTCDEEYNETCKDNVAYLCGEAAYQTVRECKNIPGSTCRKMAEDNIVECALPCNNNTFKEYTSCEGDKIAYHFCEKTTQDDYYEFIFTDESCPFGCANGECLDPVVGAECDCNFDSTCYNDAFWYCDNNKIAKEECPQGTSCAFAYGEKDHQCVAACGGTGDGDRYGCNGKALDNWVCRVGTDAAFHYFHETTVCASSCNDGVCDVAIPEIGTKCQEDMNDICAHNNLYYCNTLTNEVDIYECGLGDNLGQPLCRQLNQGYSDCVMPDCIPGEEDYSCATGSDGGTKFKYISGWYCAQGSDGTFYMFNHEERCPGDCKNGKCL